MKFASDFEVMRGVRADGRAMCATQPRAKPIRVAVLLNEAAFTASGHALHHHNTVFLDERGHDWDWRNGQFHYYSHAVGLGDKADILVVYEVDECAEIVRHEA